MHCLACTQAAGSSEAEQPAKEQSALAQKGAKKGWQLSPEGDAAILHGPHLPLSHALLCMPEGLNGILLYSELYCALGGFWRIVIC